MPAVPEVSVVIPVKDGADAIPVLLASLGDQTLDAARFEVIVVDNASTDATADVARAAGARVVSEPVANRSRARNAGVAAAAADFIAFTDADCVASKDWLEGLLAARGAGDLLAGGVRVTTTAAPNAVERFERLWRFGQENWVHEGWAATANLAIERPAFDAIEGFDPGYRHYGEDADLCVRATRAGFTLAWAPGAEVSHYAEDRLRPMLRRAYYHGFGGVQATKRLGLGYRAWRHPRALIDSERAMQRIGMSRDGFSDSEWKMMGRLAKLAYGARIVGSVWAELTRAR